MWVLRFFFPAKPTSTHTYGKKARISVSGHETRSTGSPKSGKTWISVSEHETWSTGSLKSGKSWISVSGHETRSTGTPKTGKSWISMSGHETRSTGSLNSGKTPVDRVSCPDTVIRVFLECEFPWTGFHLRVRTWNPVHGNSHSGKTRISVSGHETRSTGQIDVLLFLPRVQFTQNHPIFMQNWMYRIWM